MKGKVDSTGFPINYQPVICMKKYDSTKIPPPDTHKNLNSDFIIIYYYLWGRVLFSHISLTNIFEGRRQAFYTCFLAFSVICRLVSRNGDQSSTKFTCTVLPHVHFNLWKPPKKIDRHNILAFTKKQRDVIYVCISDRYSMYMWLQLPFGVYSNKYNYDIDSITQCHGV